MRLTREAFAELFGVHLPAAVPCAWVKGVCFVFVDQVGRDRIKKALLDYCGRHTGDGQTLGKTSARDRLSKSARLRRKC